MTTSAAPFGFSPSRKRGMNPNAIGTNEYPIASGYAANIFTGDLVRINAGNLQTVTDTNEVVQGVFMGCRYVENGEQKFKSYFPSGTSVTDAFGIVCDDPNQVFEVQADASVTAGDLFGSQNFGVVLGAGSTFTGKSGHTIDASTRTSGIAMVRALDSVNEPGNQVAVATERAFLKLNARLVQHTDNFFTTIVSVPTTITAYLLNG
jgi:hypothetical protein|tara:strand:- start:678 stop:1295 length:618 start_codon:yes stop_codon:yes gene_type:complete